MEQVKKSIMVTWDFSAVSYSALKHAIRLSHIVKYNIVLFHIVDDPSELEAAKENDIMIPHLCYLHGVDDITSCRVCVVEIEGRKNLVPSCSTPVTEGMVI